MLYKIGKELYNRFKSGFNQKTFDVFAKYNEFLRVKMSRINNLSEKEWISSVKR